MHVSTHAHTLSLPHAHARTHSTHASTHHTNILYLTSPLLTHINTLRLAHAQAHSLALTHTHTHTLSQALHFPPVWFPYPAWAFFLGGTRWAPAQDGSPLQVSPCDKWVSLFLLTVWGWLSRTSEGNQTPSACFGLGGAPYWRQTQFTNRPQPWI